MIYSDIIEIKQQQYPLNVLAFYNMYAKELRVGYKITGSNNLK